ncbi:hypothetical protein KM043_012639 [Ampulex compressa]|nr:hypothetical protein KM043_012639 [Ampulex compressa]
MSLDADRASPHSAPSISIPCEVPIRAVRRTALCNEGMRWKEAVEPGQGSRFFLKIVLRLALSRVHANGEKKLRPPGGENGDVVLSSGVSMAPYVPPFRSHRGLEGKCDRWRRLAKYASKRRRVEGYFALFLVNVISSRIL